MTRTLHTLRDQYRRHRATLPWAELEAEAARQGCSPADIFFDRAGRRVAGLPPLPGAPAARASGPARDPRPARAPAPRTPTFKTGSRRT